MIKKSEEIIKKVKTLPFLLFPMHVCIKVLPPCTCHAFHTKQQGCSVLQQPVYNRWNTIILLYSVIPVSEVACIGDIIELTSFL